MDERELINLVDELFEKIKDQEERIKHNSELENIRKQIHVAFRDVKISSMSHCMTIAKNIADRLGRTNEEKNLILQRLRETVLSIFEGTESKAIAEINKAY